MRTLSRVSRRLLLVLFVPALLILAAGIGTWLLWVGPGPASAPVTIIVDQGSSVAKVAGQLEAAGAIRGNATTFRGFARLFGAHAPVQAGELHRLWRARRPGAAVVSPEAAIILASIVEKETGKPSERRLIAGVYSNRLRRGMPLQADPTVIYPVTRGRPLGRRILLSELRANNGYNTYASAGLPIGPIANPGRDSIAAVLDPAPTNALYFVADGTGGHVFADTLAQHQANVARWYALRRARGEM